MLLKKICSLAMGAVVANGAIVGGTILLKETKNEPQKEVTVKSRWADGLKNPSDKGGDWDNIHSDYNSFGL